MKISKEEAIKILSRYDNEYYTPATREAHRMGIEALREQEERRWIPVTERLPDTISCNAGTAYSEAVNVLTSGRKVLTAIWDGTGFIADADFWKAEGEVVTHWTPMLLPLPEPPKGD